MPMKHVGSFDNKQLASAMTAINHSMVQSITNRHSQSNDVKNGAAFVTTQLCHWFNKDEKEKKKMNPMGWER